MKVAAAALPPQATGGPLAGRASQIRLQAEQRKEQRGHMSRKNTALPGPLPPLAHPPPLRVNVVTATASDLARDAGWHNKQERRLK